MAVLKQGFLLTESPSWSVFSLGSKWEKRYFTLYPNELVWTLNGEQVKCPRSDVTNVESVDATRISINLNNKPALVVKGQTSEESSVWLSSLLAWRKQGDLKALDIKPENIPFKFKYYICETVWGNLRQMVKQYPNDLAIKYLDHNGKEEVRYTYQQLHNAICQVSELLIELKCKKGDRVILAYPPGLQFYIAFLGCVKLGVIAVPVYPPSPGRLQADLERLGKLIGASGASWILTSNDYDKARRLMMLRAYITKENWPASVQWRVTDVKKPAHRDVDMGPLPMGPHDLAFLQFTSGSTGDPKGVMVTNRNLVHNFELIGDLVGRAPRSWSMVSWLPMYHDMGLIGTFLSVVCGGGRVSSLSPFTFLKSPYLWIYVLSREKAVITAFPNFSLDLAVKKWKAPKEEKIDLSTVEVLVNGAEPVKMSSCKAFMSTFAPYGLRPDAMFPAFGLAEHTLIVTSCLDKTNNRLRSVVDDKGVERVSLGVPMRPEVEVQIVDPDTCELKKTGEVGECWISSPSKTLGYWGRPDVTKELFYAQIAGDKSDKRYLRTGDLMFWKDGELYFAGRAKDLIIVSGRNYYPQDLEQTVEQLPHIRPGCSAAFAVDTEDGEAAALVAELDLKDAKSTPQELQTLYQNTIANIARTVQAQHGVPVKHVVLIKDRTIPKTTSGKIKRKGTKEAFLAGKLSMLASREFDGKLDSLELTDDALGASSEQDGKRELTAAQTNTKVHKPKRSSLQRLITRPYFWVIILAIIISFILALR